MTKIKLTDGQYELLKSIYLQNFPDKIPDEVFCDYDTVLKHRQLIKYSNPDKKILNHLLDIVIDKIKNNKRFQRITFIKLIHSQCDNRIIDNKITEKLFFVFKSLINEVNDQIAWKLSVTIKDIELEQENINWLIANYEDSEHIQNRLLRYPNPNKGISAWAEERLKKRDMQERESELIGLKLNFDMNYNFEDKSKLIWGVHYAKISSNDKKKLLLRHMVQDNFEEFLKICEKNDFNDIISQIYTEYK